MRATLKQCGIQGVGFKCFGDTPQGISGILPFNVVVGRNNSGKSGLLDLVGFACAGAPPLSPQSKRASGKDAAILVTSQLSNNDLRKVFQANTSGGPLPGNHWEFGQQFVGHQLTRDVCTSSVDWLSLTTIHGVPTALDRIDPAAKSEFLKHLAGACASPLGSFFFHRLGAERDVRPEQVTTNALGLESDGRGATAVVQAFLTRDDLNRRVVESTLLSALNSICEPDFAFTRISCLLNQQTQFWEIYLTQAEKGDIRLSQSGSGLKTILLTLLILELQPLLKTQARDRTIFALEELENNLHPALLRRLLAYLRHYSDEHGSVFFLTTHSSVTVDVFADQEDAQIIHVQHDNKDAQIAPVSDYLSRRGILDDLDIRASDILQSNGIIWVEGPSDRRYLNRWIELWSDGKLYEGNHYRILIYGGKLLSHFSSSDPAETQSAIALLAINRNLALLMDSDKKKPWGRINDTKRRVKKEVDTLGGLSWITQGREIENYLSHDLLTAAVGEPVPALDQYEHFFNEFVPKLLPAKGKLFSRGKVPAADFLVQHMTAENIRGTLDFNDWMDSLCRRIRRWNRISN